MVLNMTACCEYQSSPFTELLTQDEVTLFKEKVGPHRKRIYSPAVTLSAFMEQSVEDDSSCRDAVASVLVRRSSAQKSCSLNTASYIRARQKIPMDAVRDLSKKVAINNDSKSNENWLWKGKAVKFIDGSTVSIAETKSNKLKFPLKKNQKDGCSYPLGRIGVLTSLSTGSVADISLGPFVGKGQGELWHGIKLMDSLSEDEILVADSFYATYPFIYFCKERKVGFVSVKKGNRGFTELAEIKLGNGDRLIKVVKPRGYRIKWLEQEVYESLPESMWIRETKVTITRQGFRSKKLVLYSTIDAETYSPDDIAELMRLRWHIEVDLRFLKQEIGATTLKCKSPEMVEKELIMRVLAYNLIRRLTIQLTHESAQTTPRELSFKTAKRLYNCTGHRWRALDSGTVKNIAYRYTKARLTRQLHRFEPRAKKPTRNHNCYPILTLTRSQWRALKILPYLEFELEWSSALTVGIIELSKKMPKSGAERLKKYNDNDILLH